MHIYLELWLTKMCRVTDSYHHLPPVASPLVAPANECHPGSDARNTASRQLFAPISGTNQVEGTERVAIQSRRFDAVASRNSHRTVIFMGRQSTVYSQTAGAEDISKQNRSIDFNHRPDFLRVCSVVMRNECYSRDGPSTMPISSMLPLHRCEPRRQ
ncbi:hypothetical protein CGCSCA4_v008190 [Colletotrichum siamense]|uniref:Uncharacterized protein n=1 Tax=Colletotrichum siamense TaxID=690259 RepID=A0A9P5K554_COLSI|nr:hypothetical protein CGCSCA4_v008190 [Colletotrichum siamense]KAF4859054.1 hypothetical protein CGCSCA2_v006694 [Colletotrichum siamense]